MRILFYSTSPHIGVGYGTLSTALIKRMQADGHYVKVATKHLFGGIIEMGGVEIFNGTDHNLVWKVFIDEKFDYTISCFDHWTIPPGFTLPRWVMVEMLDVEHIHFQAINALKRADYVVATTKHAEGEFSRAGFHPQYAPLGVDTSFFKPSAKARKEFRDKMGWDDNTFVIGSVAINYPVDKKNHIGVIRAFQGFHKQYPNSVLYLHCDVTGASTQGVPLTWVMEQCGFKSDNAKGNPIRFVDQTAYQMWSISAQQIANTYNAMDVFILATRGEGFGLPIIEAQSTGIPVILSDATANRELLFGGWIIPKQEDWIQYNNLMSWHIITPPSAIAFYLDEAITLWKDKEKWNKLKKKARRGVLKYDWDVVYDKYWRPLLKKLEGNTEVKTLPNYREDFYVRFNGYPLMRPACNTICNNTECTKLKDDFHFLPNEKIVDTKEQNLFKRLYPFIPSVEGVPLIDTACTIYPFLAPRFIRECQKAISMLWEYPLIRKDIKDLWDSGFFKGKYVTVEEAQKQVDFNKEYINSTQLPYYTKVEMEDGILNLLKQGDKILDVGTGDGKRVVELREKGFEVWGTEINKNWVNTDKFVVEGSAEQLPFEDNSFDMVMSVEVLEHLGNPIKAIKEMCRVSKKYVLACVTPTEDMCYLEDPTHKVEWSRDRWRRELSEFGKLIWCSHKTDAMVIEKYANI